MRALLPLPALVSLLICTAAQAAPETAKAGLPAIPLYPGEVALMEESDGWVYRQFGTALRLYVSDLDPAGRSVCNEGCAEKWFPLWARDGAQPIGDWSIVVRKSGRRQWALNGKPVYTRLNESPAAPTGDGFQGVWHILKHRRLATDLAERSR